MKSIQIAQRGFIAGIFAGLCPLLCMVGGAQTVAGAEVAPTLVAADVLPDAPSAAVSSSSDAIAEGGVARFELRSAARKSASGQASPTEVSRTEQFIEPGERAPALSSGDMVLLGVKNSFSLIAIAGWFTSAGYSHWMNSAPNYGTDRGAFGQRLGAAAILNSSEDLLTNSVMAPILHEDPRYYRMGPGHNFFVRAAYAATRPVITRTTSGRTSPNLALILGNAEGAALANAYYPQVNRGATQTMENLGLSIGGSAIADALGEFYGDVLKALHVHH
ncbi:MAG: hypothetical protein M3O31_17385 [Acidobacteriota bacterium]|nr:hypothetical protein [Acidobacteriota bacterium]